MNSHTPGRIDSEDLGAEGLVLHTTDDRGPSSSTKDCPLLRLPNELLLWTIRFLDFHDLHNLTLVNRRCASWVLSYNATAITVWGAPDCSRLMHVLLGYIQDAKFDNKPLPRFCIGPYIRSLELAVKTNSVQPALEHDFVHSLLNEAISILWEAPLVFPNLERITLNEDATLGFWAFNALGRTNVKHLKLMNVQVFSEFKLHPAIEEGGWGLQSLDLGLQWIFPNKDAGTVTPITVSILKAASSTLESLTWGVKSTTKPLTEIPDYDDKALALPNLVELRIASDGYDVPVLDDSWLKVLLKPGPDSPIRHLEVDVRASSDIVDFFRRVGKLPRLHTFIATNLSESESHEFDLTFLSCNPQMTSLSIEVQLQSQFIEHCLLPMLTRFHALQSLALWWTSPEISEISAKHLSKIQTLENLLVLAGRDSVLGPQWNIDHDAMRDLCRRLPRLRKLAFAGDIYHVDKTPKYLEMEDLLDNGGLPSEDLDRWAHMGAVLRQQHREKMLKLAESYALENKQLEWIYIGATYFRIPRTRERIWVTETNYRPRTRRDRDLGLRYPPFVRRAFGRTRDADFVSDHYVRMHEEVPPDFREPEYEPRLLLSLIEAAG